jgi:murein DD-endopeptidase MepM/ murein hydrolase activator NlpD
LPEAQQQEFSDKILETDNVKPSNDPSTSPAKSDQEQSDTNNTPDEQSDISTRNPALDPITVEVVGYNSLQQQHSDNQLQLLSTQLDNRFTVLNTIIDKQTVSLLKAIESSGMDKSYIANISNQSLAQGGPLFALETDVLSDEQKTLLDKITTLNTLMGNVEQLPKTLPAKHFYISSVYGLRNDPISKRRAMHRGIDMAGWHKTKIFSPASGIVTRAGKNGGFGNFIEITHINGFVTRYGHLAKINVKRGQQVQKDDVIGLMGSSGRSTSTHLHYEILHNKRHINPLKFIKAFDNVSE